MKTKFYSLGTLLFTLVLGACTPEDYEVKFDVDSAVLVRVPLISNNGYTFKESTSTHINGESTATVKVKQNKEWFDFSQGKIIPTDESGEHFTLTFSTKPMQTFFYSESTIDKSKPFRVYYSTGEVKLINKELYYKSLLTRNSGSSTLGCGDINGSINTVKGIVAGALEQINIKNLTSKPIEFKLLGYEADKLWYSQSCFINFDTQATTEHVPVTKEPDSKSTTVPVYDSGGWGWIYSFFPPSGHKVKDARMIAEIDGKVVKSRNTISSDLDIVPQKSYLFVVEWDGKDLYISSFDSFTNNDIQDVTGEDL